MPAPAKFNVTSADFPAAPPPRGPAGAADRSWPRTTIAGNGAWLPRPVDIVATARLLSRRDEEFGEAALAPGCGAPGEEPKSASAETRSHAAKSKITIIAPDNPQEGPARRIGVPRRRQSRCTAVENRLMAATPLRVGTTCNP